MTKYITKKELAEDMSEILNERYCSIPWNKRPHWSKDDVISNIYPIVDKVIACFFLEEQTKIKVKG